jgi:phosphoglycerate dehydrogenase-like enzyme
MPLSAASLLPPATLPLPHLVVALTGRERELFLGSSHTPPLKGLGRSSLTDDAQLSPDAWEECLRAARPNILLTGWNTPALPARWLAAPDCPLRYVCHAMGSVRNLVPRSFIERGGLVTNWGGFAGQFAAEHALLLALAALRNLNAWRPFIAQPPDRRDPVSLGTRSLFGRQVGLHGFGSIALALVPLLAPFGCTVRVFSAGVPDAVVRREGLEPCASLAELFRRSEILFECEALTAATQGSVSAEMLAALPDGAVFVNVGRGLVVDEAALVREAASGRISAAVDVTRDRMTETAELFHLPGAILSPHIAGPSHDQYRRCGELALQNIERFLHGLPPVSRVTLDIYDRST